VKAHPVARTGKFLSSILLIVVLALLGACSGIDRGSNTTDTPSKPITIGFSISLTGDFSADGRALKMGYELWKDTINKRGGLLGRQVELKSYDDESKPDQAAANYQKLISTDKVDLLLGPYSTLLNASSVKIADRSNYAFVEGSGNDSDIFNLELTNQNLFVVTLPSEIYLDGFARYILSLPENQRPKTVAYASVDDSFSTPQVAHAKAVLSKGGLKTVFEETPYKDSNAIPSIARRIIRTNPDIVILGAPGVTDCASFIKIFKQEHFSPKAFIATTGPDKGSEFTKAVGTEAAEGIFVPNSGWFPGVKTYQNEEFTQSYIAKFGGTAEDINPVTVQGYAAAQVLEQAITKAQSTDNKKLLDVLHKESFDSLFGPVKFNEKGENTLGVPYLLQWQQGKLTPVYPPANATAQPQYPKKAWS
jgi:branched-chain amino acid transport system substrate-binding protein